MKITFRYNKATSKLDHWSNWGMILDQLYIEKRANKYFYTNFMRMEFDVFIIHLEHIFHEHQTHFGSFRLSHAQRQRYESPQPRRTVRMVHLRWGTNWKQMFERWLMRRKEMVLKITFLFRNLQIGQGILQIQWRYHRWKMSHFQLR